MAFPAVVYTDNSTAAAALTNAAATAGLSLNGLQPQAQLQSIVANLLVDSPAAINTVTATLTVAGASQLGATGGAAVTTIGGTAYGAGVASLRFNGLTTAATNNLTGTLTNSPVTGNPTFWMPVSIAGVVKYIPCF